MFVSCLLLDHVHHQTWTKHWIRWQHRQDHKQIVMPFSPVFGDAVLPQAFVSCLGHSCQTRCYPCSPPKNLRPRATAPQTLNRSIRHTMLRAAGVWAVAAGVCLVPRPEACTLSQTQTHNCTPHCQNYLFLNLIKRMNTLFCVKWSIVLFLTSVSSVYHWPHSLNLVPLPVSTPAPWKYPQGLSAHM